MNIFDLFLNWKTPISSFEEMKKGKLVLTHGFDDQKNLCEVTVEIVETAVRICKNFGLPIACQFPGDTVARCEGLEPIMVIYKNLHDGGYLDTNEVNRQVAEICQKNGWTHVVVCAHPDHAWRVGKNLEKFGLTPIFPDLSGIKYHKIPGRWKLNFPWFIIREIISRVLYRYWWDYM